MYSNTPKNIVFIIVYRYSKIKKKNNNKKCKKLFIYVFKLCKKIIFEPVNS